MTYAPSCSRPFAEDPFTRAVFVFRSKRAGRLKIRFWDGSGLVMAYMILPRKSGRGQTAMRSMSAGDR
ncbi:MULTISPECIES: IS66 family insertion sequence element accessory protein TnpB [Salipiger]|uniref:IS66 family insertion sequence element accessory protein TnpB n=1 Tax=Salipiger TaxID=263377 RepID=UPI0035181329